MGRKPKKRGKYVYTYVVDSLCCTVATNTWSEMATHSRILAWWVPRQEEPGGLQSMRLQRVRHDWSNLAQHRHSHKSVCVSVCVCVCSVVSDPFQPHGLSPTRLLCRWNFPGKNTSIKINFIHFLSHFALPWRIETVVSLTQISKI